MKIKLNLPLALTALRIFVAPFLLPIAIVHVVQQGDTVSLLVLLVAFGLLCFTDFLDGYLARKYNQVTLLGRILDPVADKFLVTAALFALVWCCRVHYLVALVLVLREYVVLTLRQLSLMLGFELSVSKIAKYKTVVVMAYLALMMLPIPMTQAMRFAFALPAVFLSLYSMADYARSLFKNI